MAPSVAILPSRNGSEGQLQFLGLMARVKKALAEGKLIKVPATEIRPYADQPRKHFNKERIASLSNSVAIGGQTTIALMRYKPDNKTKTKYELIDGERRWRGIMDIPTAERPLYEAKLIEADDDVIQYLISGIANFNREPHTASETVDTIVRLHDEFKIPMPQIATLLGISEMWANQMHGLKNLHPKVKQMLSPDLPKDQQLPVTAAIQISKINASLQLGIVERFRSGDVTIGRLRSEVVRVAKDTGTEIRLREVPPMKQWDSCHNKVGLVDRTASDLEAVLKKPELSRIMKAHPGDAAKFLKQLKTAQQVLARCEALVLKTQT